MTSISEELAMEFKSEHQKLFLNLVFTSNWLKHMDIERLRPHGISPQQFNVLRILRGAGGEKMSMGAVLSRMLDRSPNATRLTDKLIAKGLVVRERCTDDRRVVHLRISDKGRRLIDSMDEETDRLFDVVGSKLSQAEARSVNKALDKLRG